MQFQFVLETKSLFIETPGVHTSKNHWWARRRTVSDKARLYL